MNEVICLCESAISWILLSKTVLPTPRNPRSICGRPVRPAMVRWILIDASSMICERPANSGGCEPAPGANGFLIGSMNVFLMY